MSEIVEQHEPTIEPEFIGTQNQDDENEFVQLGLRDYVHMRSEEFVADHPRLVSATRAIAGFTLVASGAAAGFLLTPPEDFEAGPLKGEVSIDKTISLSGGTNVDLSFLGGLDIPSHKGIGITIEGKDIVNSDDPEKIAGSLEGYEGSVEEFSAEIRRAITQETRNAIGFTALGIAISSTALYAFSEKERFKHTARSAAATTLIGASVFAGLPYLTYNESALNDTTYYGLTAGLPDFVGDTQRLADNYQNNIRNSGEILGYLGVLRGRTISSEFIPDDAVGVLVSTDIHCMPGAYELEQGLLSTFPNIAMIARTGDFTDTGSAVENEICFNGIAEIGIPQVGVRANHDSKLTEERLSNLGVTMLDYQATQQAGFNIYGVADSTDTWKAEVETRVPNSERPEDVEQILLDQTASPADILLIAHPFIAEQVLGSAKVVVTGDTHKQKTTIEDGSLFVNPGSLGGGGLRSFSNGDQGTRTASIIWYQGKEPIAVSEIDLGSPGELRLQLDHCKLDFEQEEVDC